MDFSGQVQILHVLGIDEVGTVNPEKAMRFQHFIIQLKYAGHDHWRPIRKVDAGVIALRFQPDDLRRMDHHDFTLT
ncbi:MAG TPA: hypothetical protein VFF90_01280 [Saprospiraceae bacterium]|nr:hypothetical protein [Saprospiraceae bacterium]